MKKKENNIITPKFISLLSLLLLTPYLSAQTRKIADYTVEDECGIVYCAVGDKETREIFYFSVNGCKYVVDSNIKILSGIEYEGSSYPVSAIAEKAFEGNQLIDSITLPSSIEIIKESAFSKSSLKYIELNEGLISIEQYAFDKCDSIKEIIIPSTVKSIGEKKEMVFQVEWTHIIQPFMGCTSLQNIKVSKDNPIYYSNGGCLVKRNANLIATEKEVDKLIAVPSGKKGKLVLGENIKAIGTFAFSDCFEIEEIELPKNLLSLEHGAFLGSGMKSITIPDSVSCFHLASSAFGHSCAEEILVSKNNAYFISIDGVLYCKEEGGKKSLFAFPPGKKVKVFNIPKGTAYIWSSAFNNAFRVEKVVVPEGIKKIPWRCFYGTSNLKEIRLPSTVEEIGEDGLGHVSERVIIDASTPPRVELNEEGHILNLEAVTICVPNKSTELYRKDDDWGYYRITSK